MNTKQLEKIRVYVGTYHKYNNGSIAGRWLTLNDYKTPEAFWAACKQLHRDERDPEFMFQDYEVPDFLGGCVTESYIDTKEIWKYLSGELPAEEQEVETTSYTKQQLKQWKDEYVQIRLNDGYVRPEDKEKHDAYWRPYYEKKYLVVIKLDDKYYPVEKLSIKTTFCFGAGSNGISTAEDWKAASNAQSAIHQFDNWLKANTEETESDIIGLSDPYGEGRTWRDHGHRAFVCYADKEMRLLWRYSICGDMPDDAHEPTAQEKSVLLAGLQMQLEDITKRCKTYWKRYGSSKLNTWTYLRD